MKSKIFFITCKKLHKNQYLRNFLNKIFIIKCICKQYYIYLYTFKMFIIIELCIQKLHKKVNIYIN